MKNQIIKIEFDFGWKKMESLPPYINLAFQYQQGDILDIGCGPCQLYEFLKKKNWKGRYYGIDFQKYGGFNYSPEINLIIGNALEIEFPKVDTVILYNILEHVEEPLKLLKKAIQAAKKNVLINVPKRNEEMWKYGIVEYHQLDKSHQHCGFSKKEIYRLVNLAGGKIITYKELGKIDAKIGIALWKSLVPKAIVYLLAKIFPSKIFFSTIWCEVIKAKI
jgi:SAM-dependent methyltransferase